MAAVAKQRSILSRVEVQVVTAVVEGDRVLGEMPGPVLRCHALEELEQVWAKAEAEVAEANAEANRATRRGARARARGGDK